ncbi:MAG: aminotransferase class I/II-fold pyridoxal phosphate-dependent enzyme [Chloroflexia bacterium]|nr:aminotransferase class I/II-fold pyridoxal phosphate-dependent enzyme [Chloroflexia bacterium]
MNRGHAHLATPLARQGGLIRLDRLTNPFGPSPLVARSVTAALDATTPSDGGSDDLFAQVISAVASHAGTSPDRVVLANGTDALIDALLLWRRDLGPFVTFSPTDAAFAARARQHRVERLEWPRVPGNFGIDLAREPAGSRGSTALVMSPNDPTGNPLDPTHLVRLARTCELVLIDERHAAYAGRNAAALASEFDNVVLLSTLSTWAGLDAFPLAYATGPARIIAGLRMFCPPTGVAASTLAAAAATFGDLPAVLGSVRRLRLERARLWRTLRKSNLLSLPYPSSANFILARVERGTAAEIAAALRERGILVHVPSDPSLGRDHFRITVGPPESTVALGAALAEIAGQTA